MDACSAAIYYIRLEFGIEFETFSNPDASSTMLFLMMGIIVPIVEELSFRFQLTRKRSLFLYASAFCLLDMIISFFFYNYFIPINILVLGIHLSLFLKIFKINSERKLITIYAVLFGLAHNYNFLPMDHLIVHVPYFIAIFIAGYIYSIIRLKYGIIYSCLAHILLNSHQKIVFFVGNLILGY